MLTKLKGKPITVPLPVQLKEAAEFREVKLKGKNHILKTGHYRLKNELKSDHKKVEQLQEQVLSGSLPVIWKCITDLAHSLLTCIQVLSSGAL